MEQVTPNTNKYEAFYESIIDFAVELNLSNYSDFRGVNEMTILDFEAKNPSKLPVSIKIFLKYFGEKIGIKSTDTNLRFTIHHIKEATKEASKNNITLFLKNNKLKDFIRQKNGFNPETDINQIIDINQIMYLQWDDSNQALCFIDSTQENPILYYLMEFNLFTTANWSFTNHLRSILFLALSSQFYKKDDVDYNSINNLVVNEGVNNIRLNWIEWVKTYKKIFKNNTIDWYDIQLYRQSLYSIINEAEEKENRIYTMDEFEWAFLNYIRERI